MAIKESSSVYDKVEEQGIEKLWSLFIINDLRGLVHWDWFHSGHKETSSQSYKLWGYSS